MFEHLIFFVETYLFSCFLNRKCSKTYFLHKMVLTYIFPVSSPLLNGAGCIQEQTSQAMFYLNGRVLICGCGVIFLSARLPSQPEAFNRLDMNSFLDLERSAEMLMRGTGARRANCFAVKFPEWCRDCPPA